MALPFPTTAEPRSGRVPTDEECFGYWNRFRMLEHIRHHSLLVAEVATALARRAREKGLTAPVQMIRASALLHDLAKTYTIEHGGNHCQIGAAWIVELTGSPQVAQGVYYHVRWPFEKDPARYFLPLAVQYGDKRVMHDRLVGVAERFEDLEERYGATEDIRRGIRRTMEDSLVLEDILSQTLEVDLDACTFDRGRLVPGT